MATTTQPVRQATSTPLIAVNSAVAVSRRGSDCGVLSGVLSLFMYSTSTRDAAVPPRRLVGSHDTITFVNLSLRLEKPIQMSAVRPIFGSDNVVSAVITAGAMGTTAGVLSSSARGAQ